MSLEPLQIQLIWAAYEGDEKIVRSLLAQKVDVNCVTTFAPGRFFKDSTPLIEAAEKGHRKVVDLLIAAKADVNFPSLNLKRFPYPPIFHSSCTGKEEDCCMIALLKNGAQLMSDLPSRSDGDAFPIFGMASNCNLLALKTAFTYSLAHEQGPRKALMDHVRVCLLDTLHLDLIPIVLEYHDTTELDLAHNAIKLANHTAKVPGWPKPQSPLSLSAIGIKGESIKNDVVRFLISMGANPGYLVLVSTNSIAYVRSTQQIVAAALVKKQKREQHEFEAILTLKRKYHSEYEPPFSPLELFVMQNLRRVREELASNPESNKL